MCLRDRTKYSLDAGCHPGFVGSAFEDRGLDTGVGDALLDVTDEQVGHDLGPVQRRTRAEVVETERHVGVGVDAGRDDDVEIGGRGDSRDPRDVAAESDDGEIDDGVDASCLQLVEPRDRARLPRGVLTPRFRVVLHDFRRHDEDVFVHQRHTEIVGVDRAPRRIHFWHSGSLLRGGRLAVHDRHNRHRERADRDERQQLNTP